MTLRNKLREAIIPASFIVVGGLTLALNRIGGDFLVLEIPELELECRYQPIRETIPSCIEGMGELDIYILDRVCY
ncbi:MAG: hypothetical protein KKG75_02150 [Nanoarchaeota archaeon]|nr:hypothetical protein [Nanoarchaeota archaeon]